MSPLIEVSALGIDEQRVHVIVDIEDAVSMLGDGYRVEGQIVIWESPKVLQFSFPSALSSRSAMSRALARVQFI